VQESFLARRGTIIDFPVTLSSRISLVFRVSLCDEISQHVAPLTRFTLKLAVWLYFYRGDISCTHITPESRWIHVGKKLCRISANGNNSDFNF